MNWSEWQLLVIIDGALFARILSCFDSLRTVIFTSVKKLLCFKSKALIKANILYWYLNSMRLCWTLFLNRWPFIKQYVKSVSVSHEKLFWNVRAFDKYCMFICDKSIQTPREHHYREQKESDFTSPHSPPPPYSRRLVCAALHEVEYTLHLHDTVCVHKWNQWNMWQEKSCDSIKLTQ